MPKDFTTEETAATISIVKAVAEAIRDLGQVPSGEFYMRLQVMMPTFTLGGYQAIIRIIEEMGLIDTKNHLITWIGPLKGES